MPRMASDLPSAEQVFLLNLETLALRYFLDNQAADGLFLDRQRNFGPRRADCWRSTAASGMGLIAVAVASAEPFRLIERSEAVERVRRTLHTALETLPHTHGVMPHFLDAAGKTVGSDACSTIDSTWLVAGGLWAAAFLALSPLDGAPVGGPVGDDPPRGRPPRPFHSVGLGPHQRRDRVLLRPRRRRRGRQSLARSGLVQTATLLRDGRRPHLPQRRPGPVRLPVRPGPAQPGGVA